MWDGRFTICKYFRKKGIEKSLVFFILNITSSIICSTKKSWSWRKELKFVLNCSIGNQLHQIKNGENETKKKGINNSNYSINKNFLRKKVNFGHQISTIHLFSCKFSKISVDQQIFHIVSNREIFFGNLSATIF